MPYHLEKGPVLQLLEDYLNSDRKTMRRRLEKLRRSKGTMDWATAGLFHSLDEAPFEGTPQGGRQGVYEHLMKDWFGCELVGGQWVRKDRPLDPKDPQGPGTTGFWLAYSGNVLEIFRQAMVWSLELALGLSPDDDGRGRWWPHRIEMFWKCPTPWFEAWVVRRPIAIPFCRRGIVTLLFLTPSTAGSNVSETPIAHHSKTRPPDHPEITHPVPSTERDYEELGKPPPNATGVAAVDRRHAMWVVTHTNHQLGGTVAVTTDTTTAQDFAEWGIAQVGVLEGKGKVVVVSPSLAAGGVTHDARLP